MFESITASLIELIRSQGILAVILGVLIETIIVPIPSPLIMMAAGAILISSGSFFSIFFSILLISIVAGLTQTIGSLLLYLPSYHYGKPFLKRFERFHGVSWEEISEFEKKFNGRTQNFVIFVLRAIPIMPISIVSVLSGLLKIKFKEYVFYSFLGTIPRNFTLVVLGWFLKETYVVSASGFDNVESIVTFGIIILIIAYIIAHKSGFIWKMRKKIFSEKLVPGKVKSRKQNKD